MNMPPKQPSSPTRNLALHKGYFLSSMVLCLGSAFLMINMIHILKLPSLYIIFCIMSKPTILQGQENSSDDDDIEIEVENQNQNQNENEVSRAEIEVEVKKQMKREGKARGKGKWRRVMGLLVALFFVVLLYARIMTRGEEKKQLAVDRQIEIKEVDHSPEDTLSQVRKQQPPVSPVQQPNPKPPTKPISTPPPPKNQLLLQQQQHPTKTRPHQLLAHYSPGLQHYYQSIQQNITVIKYQPARRGAGAGWLAYVVDGFVGCQRQGCLDSVRGLVEGVGGDVAEVLWLVRDVRRGQDKDVLYQVVTKYLKDNFLPYSIHSQPIDITYSFITKHISRSTSWLILSTPQHTPTSTPNPNPNLLQTSQKLAYIYPPTSSPSTQNIQYNIDLSELDSSVLARYGLCFRVELLGVITPVNFAYQNVYSMGEILGLPVLGVGQLAGALGVNQRIVQFAINRDEKSAGNRTEFVLARRKSQEKGRHVCFVAYPTIPVINSVTEILEYLDEFYKFVKEGQPQDLHMTIILSLVYSPLEDLHEVTSKILKLVKLNPRTKIKLKLRKEQVLSSLQIYELAHGYCPSLAPVFASRLNTLPSLKPLLSSLFKSNLCQSDRYLMLASYENSQAEQEKVSDLTNVTIRLMKRSEYLKYFQSHFLYAQIFCMRLIEEFRLEIFKWQELEFYQTEAAFAIPLLERAIENTYYQPNSLYRVMSSRQLSEKERRQINGLAYRDAKKGISLKPIEPVKYCQLNNHAYKRNPPQLIPAIIHQIWLSDAKQISPLRKALTQTLLKTNPDFQYRLWTFENMTRQNFPITFDSILKFQAISQQFGKNYRALIADLMRIQILYRYGGIYMDLKVEGKQSLRPFLKYEQFYFVANQDNVVNGLIGSAPGDRRFKVILEEFFRPEVLGAPKKHIYELTGGTKLVEAYTLKQVFTQVLNFQQFILEGPRPCVHGSANTEKQEDQQQFTGITAFVKKSKYRVLIPCKDDPEKYLQIYDIIGRTYFPNAEPFS